MREATATRDVEDVANVEHTYDQQGPSPDSDTHGKRAFNMGIPKDSDNTSGKLAFIL